MKSFEKRAKIAITGGAGYIGSFTVKYLKNIGFENLVILDNFSTGHKEVCFTRLLEVDLQEYKKLNEIFISEQFDAVIHFASLIVVPHSMDDPYKYFSHNVNSSLNLLEVMKENGVRNIVFSSTCAVYGIPEKMPIVETADLSPESVYAESKLMIEKIIEWYSKIFAINYAHLRYFNACGASSDASNGEMHSPETHLIPCAIANLLARKPIEIYGNDYDTPDKTCIRDYIHVDDLAEAHYLALKYIMDRGKSEIFNLGVGHGSSNLEVINAIIQVAKNNGIEGTYVFRPRRSGDVPVLFADNSKAKKILDWSPKHDNIEEIVKEAFNFHKKNSNV